MLDVYQCLEVFSIHIHMHFVCGVCVCVCVCVCCGEGGAVVTGIEFEILVFSCSLQVFGKKIDIFFFFFLAVSGLSCSMRDLC